MSWHPWPRKWIWTQRQSCSIAVSQEAESIYYSWQPCSQISWMLVGESSLCCCCWCSLMALCWSHQVVTACPQRLLHDAAALKGLAKGASCLCVWCMAGWFALLFLIFLIPSKGMRMGFSPAFPIAQPSRRVTSAPSPGQHCRLGSRFWLSLEKQKEGNSLACPFYFWEPCLQQPGLKGFLWATVSHNGVRPPTLYAQSLSMTLGKGWIQSSPQYPDQK